MEAVRGRENDRVDLRIVQRRLQVRGDWKPNWSPASLAAAFGSAARMSSVSRDFFIRAPILRAHQPRPTDATPTIPLSPVLYNHLAASSHGWGWHDDQRRRDIVLVIDDLAHFVVRNCAGIHRTEDERDAVDNDGHTADQADIDFLERRGIGACAAAGEEPPPGRKCEIPTHWFFGPSGSKACKRKPRKPR
jgi:hypothetical protein